MLALWSIANVTYSLQGVCLLNFGVKDDGHCSSGYTSESFTKPLVSLEFLLIASSIEITGLLMLAKERKVGTKKPFS